jgi:hypothetical protein
MMLLSGSTVAAGDAGRLLQGAGSAFAFTGPCTSPLMVSPVVVMSTLHGLAHLVLEEKAAHFFRNATSRNFLKKELPEVLERLYPDPSLPPIFERHPIYGQNFTARLTSGSP